jgi:hypothetical protein
MKIHNRYTEKIIEIDHEKILFLENDPLLKSWLHPYIHMYLFSASEDLSPDFTSKS